MVLFGLAAFAVDIGYRYQSKFGLQAAADASLRAAMPLFVNNNTSGASSAALLLASKNGYSTGVTVGQSSTWGPTTSQVSINMPPRPPSSWACSAPRARSRSARPRSVKRSAAAACPSSWPWGPGRRLKISSNAGSTFNGDIESNGAARIRQRTDPHHG